MESRRTCRLVVLNQNGHVLLLKIVDERLPAGSPAAAQGLWITPGGGLKDGEDPRTGAERELLEETGLRADISEPRWYGEQVITVNGSARLVKETFFTARVTNHEISRAGLEADEASVIREYRWWSAEDLARTTEAYAPAILPELLEEATVEPGTAPVALRLIDLS